MDQTHVVIQRCPRHDGDVVRRLATAVLEVFGDRLFHIDDRVLVGDLHTGRAPGRARGVLQICDLRISLYNNGIRCRIKVQGIDFDDPYGPLPGLCLGVLANGVDHGGGGQDGSRRAVAQRARNPVIVLPGLRHRQRYGDETGRNGAQETDDVLESLRGQHRRPVTRGPALGQCRGDDVHPVRKLRPGEAFGKPGRVRLVVDERVSHIVGLLRRPPLEQGGDGVVVALHQKDLSLVDSTVSNNASSRLPAESSASSKASSASDGDSRAAR